MAQVTIYLDGDTEGKMLKYLEVAEVSKSKWITDLIRDKLNTDWPADFTELAGSITDFPSVDDIRVGEGTDLSRETF